MKKKCIIIPLLTGFIFLLIIIGVFLIPLFSIKQYILVLKLEEIPDNFINISESNMQNYPTLRKAVVSPRINIEIKSDENNELLAFFGNSTTNFNYNNNYYKLLWSD